MTSFTIRGKQPRIEIVLLWCYQIGKINLKQIKKTVVCCRKGAIIRIVTKWVTGGGKRWIINLDF